MQQHFLYTSIYLFFFVFIIACGKPNKPSFIGNDNRRIDPIPINPISEDSFELVAPRIDSVLQFESMITAIFEDSKGNFWFGSHCDGLCKYNPADEKKRFTYYTVQQGLPKGKILEFAPGTNWSKTRKVSMGNSIRSIQEDKKGNLWFGTGNGISRFDGQSFTTVFPEKESILITDSFDSTKKNRVQAWQEEYDNLWFGEADKNGVYRLSTNQKLTHLTFPLPNGKISVRESMYASYSLYKDSAENLWFGTESGGILRYNGNSTPSFTCINEQEQKGVVRAFFEDNTGKIWIANNTVGLCYYDPTEKKLVNFTEKIGYFSYNYTRSHPNADDSKTLDGVQTIRQDEDGQLWFGTFGDGLYRYDPSAEEASEAITYFTKENGLLPSNTVKSIYKDKQGKLWFGIGEGTIYHFNGTSFERVDGKKIN